MKLWNIQNMFKENYRKPLKNSWLGDLNIINMKHLPEWFIKLICSLHKISVFFFRCCHNFVKVMAPHSNSLVWKIPWTEEPGRLQSMGSQRVGHHWVTSLSFSLSCSKEGNGNPLQCSCLENPRDSRAWWAAIYGVAQSCTWLKRLSSSSSIHLPQRKMNI